MVCNPSASHEYVSFFVPVMLCQPFILRVSAEKISQRSSDVIGLPRKAFSHDITFPRSPSSLQTRSRCVPLPPSSKWPGPATSEPRLTPNLTNQISTRLLASSVSSGAETAAGASWSTGLAPTPAARRGRPRSSTKTILVGHASRCTRGRPSSAASGSTASGRGRMRSCLRSSGNSQS
jgi:hypothetical protein